MTPEPFTSSNPLSMGGRHTREKNESCVGYAILCSLFNGFKRCNAIETVATAAAADTFALNIDDKMVIFTPIHTHAKNGGAFSVIRCIFKSI